MALSGWIKLHRALSDHWLASNPDSLSVWVHMLMLANHAETKRQINGSVVVVLPGQIITSRRSLSEKTGVQESKVERILKRLESEQQITQRGLSKFRVISIVNWAEYQSSEQQSEQQVNSKRTAGEQQVNTPEEVLPGGNTQEGKEDKSSCDQQAGSPKAARIDYKLITAGFGEHLSALPQPRDMTEKRKRAIQSIVSRGGRYAEPEFFAKFFAYVAKSDFLMGRGAKPWHGCCFDWLLKPENFQKIIEGNYHGEGNNA